MSKQRKVHGIGKRFMSGLVALTVAAGMVPGAAMAVSAEFSDKAGKLPRRSVRRRHRAGARGT